jgi:hypothetical protein
MFSCLRASGRPRLSFPVDCRLFEACNCSRSLSSSFVLVVPDGTKITGCLGWSRFLSPLRAVSLKCQPGLKPMDAKLNARPLTVEAIVSPEWREDKQNLARSIALAEGPSLSLWRNVPRGGAIVAWHEVPEKAPSRKGRPVGYGVAASRRLVHCDLKYL